MISRIALVCAGIALGLLVSILPAGAAFLQPGNDSVHPWDYPPRFHTHRFTGTDYGELYDYYYYGPQRSKTHALDPLHRRRYYNPHPYALLGTLEPYGKFGPTDLYEYNDGTSRWSRASTEVRNFPAIGSDCMNYTFSVPNYRVPPFGYHCQD